jgi:hypothetical protein
MFGPEDAVLADMRVERRARSGEYQPLPTIRIPAPINDSIYVPQNSQWYRYAEMCRVGYTDNLWLRLLRRGNGEELEIE